MIGATLFSGIGAPEVAKPNWDWRWHAEIEKFPSAVMGFRHPHSVNLGDVNAQDFCERAIQRGRPNVLVFGSPCQSFSIAGGRLGMDDPRGNMALVGLAIARQLRSEWLVFENVPGLFSSYSGSDETESRIREGRLGGRADCDEDSDFAAFLAAVRECGYLGCYRVHDAQFAGVPQRRRRIFFVGYLGDWRPPAAVLLESESLSRSDPPRRKTGERVAPTLSSRPLGGGGLGTDFDLDGGRDESAIEETRISGAVSSKWAKGTGGPAGDECYNLVASPIGFSCKDYGADAVDNLSPTLIRAMGHKETWANGGGQVAVAYDMRGRDGGAQFEGPHDTANLRAASGGSSRSYVVGANWGVRRLTPRECERLQGLPDDYTLIPYRGSLATDTPRYKALGNSMAVPVIGGILDRIEKVQSILETLNVEARAS